MTYFISTHYRLKIVGRVLFFALLLGSFSAQAQTRYVSTTGTNSDPASATSWATSTTNLQGAINSISTGPEPPPSPPALAPTRPTPFA